ncbi:T-box transcription factor TBX6L [Megalops cyprinoides]|uniref:T-box transcription factor TBX6L n=1 Tax=Megalops cyprinoides TaxID=118141 RepID=UPI0018646105|nr:T-box transcription factor TBX6L [Megalops cyprinoides]
MFLHREGPFCDYSLPLNPQQNYTYCSQDWKDALLRGQCLDAMKMDTEAELSAHQIRVSLQGRELWDKFSGIGTEMIITKSGRRMFPACKVSITGLNPKAKYVLVMDMVPFDDNKYKWNRDRWEVNGVTEPHLPNRFFIHPDSPALGERWMQYPVSFHKLKLTNNTLNTSGLVILHSMHKYQPRLHILQTPEPSSGHSGGCLRFTFPEAAFIAVTAYQNSEITKLKIDNNPFAKGFRDGLNSKRYREKPEKTSSQQPVENDQERGSKSRAVLSTLDTGDGADLTVSSSEDSRSFGCRTGSSEAPNPFISAFMSQGPCGPEEWGEGVRLPNNHNTLPAIPYTSSSHYEARASRPTNAVVPLSRQPLHDQSFSESLVCGNLPHFPQSLPAPSGRAVDQQRCPGGNPVAMLEAGVVEKKERQQPEFECTLPFPPKVSRVQLPESTLRSLEMSLPSDPSGPRPLSDILNRIRGRREGVAGSPGKPIQAEAAWAPLAFSKEAVAPFYQPPLDHSSEYLGLQGMLGYPNTIAASAQLSSGHADPRVPPASLEYPYRTPLIDFYLNEYAGK